MTSSPHFYEVRPRKDHRRVDLVSDVLPFGRLWYAGADAVNNAIGYAKDRSRSRGDIYGWPGLEVHLTGQSKRTGIENNWSALTGRVIEVRAEEDGDFHILPLRMRTATSRARGLSNRCSSDHGPAGEGTGEVTAGSSGGGTDSSAVGTDSSAGGADSSGGGTDSFSGGTNSSGVDAGEVTAGDSCSVGTGEMAASGFAGAAGGGE
jgi:hypothetical protein